LRYIPVVSKESGIDERLMNANNCIDHPYNWYATTLCRRTSTGTDYTDAARYAGFSTVKHVLPKSKHRYPGSCRWRSQRVLSKTGKNLSSGRQGELLAAYTSAMW